MMLNNIRQGELFMDKEKRKRLEAKGWKEVSVQEFLGLSNEESEYIELKIALSQKVVAERKKRKLSQTRLAEKIGTDQARISRMEKGDPSVSADMLIRSLIALGFSRKHILSETMI